MSATITAYPLTWPQHFPRSAKRETGQFRTTLNGALNNVQDSLRRFGQDSGKKVDGIVISSNVTLGSYKPADAGVAVWFTWDGLQVCIPVDRYATVEANLQAIHHIIEARRTELRHGTLALVRATFTGFKSLPAPPGQDWRTVLGVNGSADWKAAEKAYLRKRSETHPDRGGTREAFDAVTRAWAECQREFIATGNP